MSSPQSPKRSIASSRGDAISRWSAVSGRSDSNTTGIEKDPEPIDRIAPLQESTSAPPGTLTATRARRSVTPSQPLPWVKWSYSVLLPIAVIFALGTWVWHSTRASEAIELTVLAAPNAVAVADATVFVGGEQIQMSSDGTVKLDYPKSTTSLRIEAPGFHAVDGRIGSDSASQQTITLRPNSMTGVMTDESSGVGLPNVSLVAFDEAGDEVASTITDDSGSYRLENLPIAGSIVIDAGSYGQHTAMLGEEPTMDMALTLRSASGLVLDGEGDPVQGAVVQSGEGTTISAGDGTYTLNGVSSGDEVEIRAPGFEVATAQVQDGRVADVQLAHQMVRAVYANYNTLTSEDGLDALIDIANTTEINAIVIDVKEGVIFYDSAVPFFNDVGTVRPAYDLDEILTKLKDNNIYAIARMVVFQDPLVAEARPDLAVQDINGGLWLNEQGVGWVSAFHEELWQANIDLAVELVERGFDEVQYDYVRFPKRR